MPRVPHGPGPGPRYELPENGMDQDHEARHDRLVPVPPPVGEFNAELEIKTHSHLHDQNQKPDIWLIDKCKTIDVGVTLPRQMDRYCNEKLRKHRDGTPDRLRGGTLHPVRRHLGAPRGCQKPSTRAALPPHTWPRGPAST